MNVEIALSGVLEVNSPDRGTHVRALVESGDVDVDGRIEALLEAHSRSMGVASVLCRVLAERNPDRDPSYVLEYFGKGRKGDSADWVVRGNPYRSSVLCAYGIPRLRQLKPVDHLTRDVTHLWSHRRGVAVVGLGDTADPAAARPVAARLADRNPKVRVSAADAVRRLARDGALAGESEDLVGDGLAQCLSHRDDSVVRHAAAALAVPALRDRLVHAREVSEFSAAAKAAVDDALAGTVVALIPLWPGEVTR